MSATRIVLLGAGRHRQCAQGRNSMTATSVGSEANGSKVPALTKKEANDLMHLFPPDVQQRMKDALAKL